MHLFFLAAGVLLRAALLLPYLAAARRRPEPRPLRAPELSPQAADRAADLLGEALDPLAQLMAHPDLGGPGFLTVQFPAGEDPAVSAQYPNINEVLYRRTVRRELDRQELVESWTTIADAMVTAESERRAISENVYLCGATDEEKFGEFIHLRDWKTGEPLSLSDEGAVITGKLSELLGVTVGEEITVVDKDDVRTRIPVVGITENYIFHYIYLSHNGYLSFFGEEPEVNSIMTRYVEDTVENSDRVASAILPLSGVSSVSRTDSLRQSVLRGLEGVDYAVIVVVVAAAALAFVVLYNLTNINITERLRELATLKVLGFNDHEMSQYVYRENIFLTIFGILLGLVMGKLLHRWLVMTVEIEMAMFYRQAEPLSYILAAILTVAFSLLVNVAAKKRLRKIDMVESLKTVE